VGRNANIASAGVNQMFCRIKTEFSVRNDWCLSRDSHAFGIATKPESNGREDLNLPRGKHETLGEPCPTQHDVTRHDRSGQEAGSDGDRVLRGRPAGSRSARSTVEISEPAPSVPETALVAGAFRGIPAVRRTDVSGRTGIRRLGIPAPARAAPGSALGVAGSGKAMRVRRTGPKRRRARPRRVRRYPLETDLALLVGEGRQIVEQHRQGVRQIDIARPSALDHAIDPRPIPAGRSRIASARPAGLAP
jgi:hypothetical protein